MAHNFKIGDRVSFNATKRKYREDPKRVGIILSITEKQRKLTKRLKAMGFTHDTLYERWAGRSVVAKIRDENDNLNWTVPVNMLTLVSKTKYKTYENAHNEYDKLKGLIYEKKQDRRDAGMDIIESRGLDKLKTGDKVYVHYRDSSWRTEEEFVDINTKIGKVGIKSYRSSGVRWIFAKQCYLTRE